MKLNILNQKTRSEYVKHLDVWGDCDRCQIGRWANYHVFARGTLPCDVLFIGEAPGNTEDRDGWPFIGQAGQLLDLWITSAKLRAMDLDNQTAELTHAITNTVCCKPCNEAGGKIRPPSAAEQGNCKERFSKFMNGIASPIACVFLGKVAQAYYPQDGVPLMERMVMWGMPVCELIHPAGVLRRGGKGSKADQEARKILSDFFIQVSTTKMQIS